MRPDRWTWARTGALTLPLILATLGCGEDPAAPSPGTTKDKEKPQAKAAEVDWCGGHGVPESICTRCNKDLIAGSRTRATGARSTGCRSRGGSPAIRSSRPGSRRWLPRTARGVPTTTTTTTSTITDRAS